MNKKVEKNISYGIITFIILAVLMAFGVSEEQIAKIKTEINKYGNTEIVTNEEDKLNINNNINNNIDKTKEILTVDFIDVGQADCILIKNKRRINANRCWKQ